MLNNLGFDLDNKVFKLVSNSDNGDVSHDTLFYYHQEGKVIWAEYSGGHVNKGTLLGRVVSGDKIVFSYVHISNSGELRKGDCTTIISRDLDGKLFLNESWQWTSGDLSSGESVLLEV